MQDLNASIIRPDIFKNDLNYMIENGWENINDNSFKKSYNEYQDLYIKTFNRNRLKLFSAQIVLNDKAYKSPIAESIKNLSIKYNLGFLRDIELFRCLGAKTCEVLLREYLKPNSIGEYRDLVRSGVYISETMKPYNKTKTQNLHGYISCHDSSSMKSIVQDTYITSSSLHSKHYFLETLFYIKASDIIHIINHAEGDAIGYFPKNISNKEDMEVLNLWCVPILPKDKSIKMAMMACDLATDYFNVPKEYSVKNSEDIQPGV